MSLLAETLVEEWLNRQGYFTIRGIKEGVREIDLLAIHPLPEGVEAMHLEVQVSLRPIGYLTPLTKPLQKELGRPSRSVGQRSDDTMKKCARAWVEKKFDDPRKAKLRTALWAEVTWTRHLVHGAVKYPAELDMIAAEEVHLIPFARVLEELCPERRPAFTATAGGDFADIMAFFRDGDPKLGNRD